MCDSRPLLAKWITQKWVFAYMSYLTNLNLPNCGSSHLKSDGFTWSYEYWEIMELGFILASLALRGKVGRFGASRASVKTEESLVPT